MDKTAKGICEQDVEAQPPQTPPKEGFSKAQGSLILSV
jgi:hypothetical protein